MGSFNLTRLETLLHLFHCLSGCVFRILPNIYLCVKSVHIRSFCGPYFPALVLNIEIYRVILGIQSKYRKIQSRKTPNAGTFHTVYKETFSRKPLVVKSYMFQRVPNTT